MSNSSPCNTPIEIVRQPERLAPIRFALFDFDGTLSLIREGWQQVMIPYFVEEIARCPDSEPVDAVESVVREFVETLTGKQTVYQCFQLVEEIEKRGGTAKDPLAYKHEYLHRLDARILHRLDGLASEAISPDCLLLPGSRSILQFLFVHGIGLALASGTDLHYVRSEASLLKVEGYFGGRIYGALDKYEEFSKQLIIDKLLREYGLNGRELLVIGDGYVEIQNGNSVGALTIGVASDEARPGNLDEWKRERLIEAGAHVIIADYRELAELAGVIGIEA